MDLELTKEQKIIRSSARDFLKKECPVSTMWAMRSDPDGYVKEVWKKMAVLGWQGIMIPEKYDGMGGSFLDLAILLEAMGEVCCPGPFFSSVVLGGTAILQAGDETQKAQWLPRLANGELILSLAVTEPGNWYGVENIQAAIRKEGSVLVLDGTKLFVENAHISDFILCVARTGGKTADERLCLVLVDARSPGVTCTMLDTLAFEKQCEVVFDRVRVPPAHVLGEFGGARSVLERLMEIAAVAKCAEMVGGMQAAFERSVAYAKERRQFGKPIGSFQAVQHHCANMVVDVDGARFLTYQAAWKIAENMPAAVEASMAKAWTSEAARKVTTLAHQIHGAISFCEEHDIHLYYRKAKAGETAFGDGNFHLARLAVELGL